MWSKPISVSLLPNIERDDLFLAAHLLFRPGLWLQGDGAGRLEKMFEDRYSGYAAAAFLSGRTALREIFGVLGIGEGDEVIVPAFSCVVVAAAVKAVGATPVFADIEPEAFSLSLATVKAVATPKTRAVVVQHTFGYPAAVDKIVPWAKARQILVIEDCAHGLEIEYRRRRLGSFGDAAIFSFGRDKAVSSVFGGMAIIKNRWANQLRISQAKLAMPSLGFVFRQLLYSLYFWFAIRLYYFFHLGKALIWVGQQAGILSKAVFPEERKGLLSQKLSARLPNGLALLAIHQMEKITRFNRHRQACVRRYAKALSLLPVVLPAWKNKTGKPYPLLRFTIRVKQPQSLYEAAEKQGIIFNNWYYPALSPAGTNKASVNFNPEQVPVAVKVASQVVNLPCHPTLTKRAQGRVIRMIKEFYASPDR